MFHTYHKALVVAGLVFCSLSSVFAYSGGLGTAGDPYQIATKADLLALAGAIADYNECFILTADIDMEKLGLYDDNHCCRYQFDRWFSGNSLYRDV